MKKILTYISALALSCGAMTSCDKWFDVEIRSIETEEDVFSSKDGILSVLANIYGRLPDDQGFNADVMNDWDESITDAYETREFLGSSHRRYWDYDLVREINLFIENLDKYSTQYLQPEDLAYFRAEGRFLRAYVYMQFAKNMGGVPLITRSFTFAEGNGSATYYQFPRNTEDSTYCFIIAECDSIKHDRRAFRIERREEPRQLRRSPGPQVTGRTLRRLDRTVYSDPQGSGAPHRRMGGRHSRRAG